MQNGIQPRNTELCKCTTLLHQLGTQHSPSKWWSEARTFNKASDRFGLWLRMHPVSSRANPSCMRKMRDADDSVQMVSASTPIVYRVAFPEPLDRGCVMGIGGRGSIFGLLSDVRC